MFEAFYKAASVSQEDDQISFPAGTPYKGIVPASRFISGTQLAAAIGLTAGSPMNDDAGWLHYVEESGMELYIAKKPLRKNVTWEAINAAQLGNKRVVVINEERYIVRFINGDPNARNYAWNRYILAVYNSKDRSGFPAGVPYWGDYTAPMLGVAVSNELVDGSHTICNEVAPQGGHLSRGNGGSSPNRGVTSSWYIPVNTTYAHYGWRPMLIKESTMPTTPFRGEEVQSDFISFADLATKLEVSGGTVINSTETWLHFVMADGREFYIPKKAIRSSLTWEYFNNLGLVIGSTYIRVQGRLFRVRFLLGSEVEPASSTLGREWNELFVPLTNGDWGLYAYSELGVGTGTSNGEMTMFKEVSLRSQGGHAAGPYPGTTGLWYQIAGQTNAGYGWRPVLEFVKDFPVYPDSGPGSKELIAGNEDLGYFGQVTGAELFTAKDFLARAKITGLTAVASANSLSKIWLKFFYKKKVIYIAKVPFASGLTWENAYKAGMVYGEKGTGKYPVTSFATDQYNPFDKTENGVISYLIPRLIRGVSLDGFASLTQSNYAGSEWAELLGRATMELNTGIAEKWDNFSMADLAGTAGEVTLGMETSASTPTTAVSLGLPSSSGTDKFNYRTTVAKTQAQYYRPVLELAKPGDLYIGDKYLGTISSSELVDGPTLASMVGLTAGIAFNDAVDWMKFQDYSGMTILVAKKPIRYQLSWNQLNTANLVLGNKIIELNGKRYKVRLLKGAESNPSGWTTAEGQNDPARMEPSEWNRFIYRMHIDNPGRAPSWESNTNADMGLGPGVAYGRLTLCQEDITSQASQVTARANTKLVDFNYVYKANGSTSTYSHYGWRPVLELIP